MSHKSVSVWYLYGLHDVQSFPEMDLEDFYQVSYAHSGHGKWKEDCCSSKTGCIAVYN